MKQTTISDCYEYHVADSSSPQPKNYYHRPQPSPSKPSSLSYKSPPSSLKIPSLSRFSLSPPSKTQAGKTTQLSKDQKQTTMSQCYEYHVVDLSSPYGLSIGVNDRMLLALSLGVSLDNELSTVIGLSIGVNYRMLLGLSLGVPLSVKVILSLWNNN